MSERYGVVIPAYNAARTLHAAVLSVQAQTVPPSSIVVVDDGSTDETPMIARAFGEPVRVLTQERLGPAAATDRGLAQLREPLVAGLDADDIWFPDKARHQIGVLEADPQLDASFCRAAIFADGMQPGSSNRCQDLWGRSAMMMRRAALQRIGPIDTGVLWGAGEMIDWLARGREAGLRFAMSPLVLVGRRRISASMTDGQKASDVLPAVHAALARKRRRQVGRSNGAHDGCAE